MADTDSNSICAPKPPTMFPLMYQNSSASSGLGSTDEVTYAPIMTSTYAPNMIYEGKEDFSTFRPPPVPSFDLPNLELASFYPNYANQQYSSFECEDKNGYSTFESDDKNGYSTFESEEDEGVMSATTLTPAEDYSLQCGEQMESTTL